MEKELKSGPRGKVLLLRHKETNERVICREFEGSAEAYRKLETLRSPHLPKILQVEERAGKVTVLEEYIQGDTLDFLLQGKPLSPEDARRTAMQICCALQTLHAALIVHRDVKPQNVILRGDTAVLIDFDASRVVKPQGAADTQVMGTAGYAAPEQYGFFQTDARADIYAMGVLINEMLTGQHPSRKLASGALLPIIEKCIEVNADKRYRDAAELLTALQNAGKGKKKGLFAAVLLTALLLAGVLFLPKETGAPAEDLPQEEETAVQEEKTPVQTQAQVWNGPLGDNDIPVADPCYFTYDLDGDGAAEEYIFGMALWEEQMVLRDEVGITDGRGANRVFVPCVWRVTATGEMEKVEEFAALLEEPSIRVWRGSNTDAPVPVILSHESPWRGGIRVEYTRTHVGIWVYEATAALEGTALRAVSITMLTIEGE